MAGNVDKVQLQVEVIRSQLDTLIRDVNNLKSQKLSITVDSTGMDAINKFNASMKTLVQNANGAGGKITEIWAGVKDGAPVRTIETVNEGLGKTTEIIRTLNEETQSYSEVQTKTTTNYDAMAKAAQRAAEANQKAEQQAKAYLLQEEQAAAKKAERYDPTPMQKQIEALTGVSNASKSAADSAKVFEKAWQDSSDKVSSANQRAAETAQRAFTTAQNNMPTLQKQFADLGRQIDNAVGKYPSGTFDKISGEVANARAALTKLDSDLAAGNISYEDYTKGVDDAKSSLRQLQSEFSQTQKDTEKLNNTTNLMGDSFVRVAAKMALWQILGNEIGKIIRAFREAVQTMKEVDTELTAIQKVTNNTDAEMEKLSQHAYEVASQYGVAVTDYLESTGTFAKAGYKELSEDMAELATKTQLVGDVNAETANQFLLSADAAFKFKGNISELSTVLDKANVIENKYATSIEKMAEGFPIVANVASMANMSIDDLMAALGTITAVTQESGTKAATALRALILNIMGDTETELEDGVTWTKDEIENLSQVLWTYSEDAMKAAQATGSIVNPMEAVAGLAKAYKEGVLTQAELAKIESDLGGKMRTNQLDALIKNFDMYSEMLDKVKDSAGSADQEVGIMLDSWESKANILKNTWTEFIANTIDTDWAKGLLDAVTWLIEGFDNLGTAIFTFSGILTAIKLPSIISTFTKFGISISNLIKYFPLLISNTKAYNLVTRSTVATVSAAQLAIGALTAAITIGIVAYNHMKQAQEEQRQAAIDAGNAAVEEAKSIEALYVSYQKADRAYSDGTGSKKAFETATLDLWKALGYETDAIDEQITRYGSLKAAIDANKGAVNELLQAKIESAMYDAKASTVAAKENILDVSYFKLRDVDDIGEALRYYDERILERNRMIDEGDTESSYFKAISKEISDLKPLVEAYNAALENQAYLENLVEDAKDGVIESYDQETDAVQENTDALDENADAASKSAEQIAEAAKTIKQQESDLRTVSKALAEYQATGRISSTTMKSLLGISSQYINLLTDENGKLRMTEDGLRSVAEAIMADVDATEDLVGITKSSSGAMDSFVAGLIDAAKQAGATDSEINSLVARMIIFNNTGLDVRGKIAALQALALQAGVTNSAIAGISLDAIGKDSGMTVAEAQKKYGMPLKEAERYVASQKKKAQNNDQALLDYWNTLADKIPEPSGTSSGGGGGSSSDANLDAHKEKVSLLKSELTLMEKQGASEEEQKSKMRQIQQALHAQAEYLRSIGASQADINGLSAEWWEWQEKINGELKSADDLLSELKSALQESIDRESDALDDEIAAIDAQIDALKKRKDSKDEELTLEEKILAVQQAQKNLADAKNERTIRQYNARSGQWEWVADQKEIKSAEDALDKAKNDLEDYREKLQYNAELAALEARKDAIKAQQDALDRQYKNFLNSLKEKTRGIGEILQDIWKNATPELKAIILENAELFKALGVDVTELSDAITAASNRIVKVGSDGKAPSGLAVGDRVVTGGGTYEITGVNPDGTYESKLVDKNQTTYNYGGKYDDAPGGGSGGSGSGGGSGGGGGNRYSGTVYAEPDDGKGGYYKISSANGLNFLNTASAGDTMRGGDGSYWVKNRNGTTSITDKYGKKYTVYDKGGVLRGLGGIKATSADEMVLPPDITSRMLTPVADERFEQRIKELGFLYGAKNTLPMQSGARFDNHAIGTQHNGNVYKLGGISISEGKARSTSVYELARMAQTLTISSGS